MKVKLEERYFEQEELGASERPYQALAKALQETFTLTSIFDAGCRDAKLLKALNNLNLNLQLSGCDYFQWAVDSAEQEVKSFVFQHDLRDKLDINNKYDLVTCFEVAEHIDPEYCDVFLNNLKSLSSKYVLLTWSEAGGENDRGNDTHLQHLNPLKRNDVIETVGKHMTLNQPLTEQFLKNSNEQPDFLWYWRKSLTVWEV